MILSLFVPGFPPQKLAVFPSYVSLALRLLLLALVFLKLSNGQPVQTSLDPNFWIWRNQEELVNLSAEDFCQENCRFPGECVIDAEHGVPICGPREVPICTEIVRNVCPKVINPPVEARLDRPVAKVIFESVFNTAWQKIFNDYNLGCNERVSDVRCVFVQL